MSPSAWRVWIEIYTYRPLLSLLAQVTLRMEGVDRNYQIGAMDYGVYRHPPHGGCG